jgi:hypothetical protein
MVKWESQKSTSAIILGQREYLLAIAERSVRISVADAVWCVHHLLANFTEWGANKRIGPTGQFKTPGM